MIYVMSDIHGNMKRWKSIMNQINLQSNDTLYILGDVIDRHADGIAILQDIRKNKNMKMLLGNHEYMMLSALDDSSNISRFNSMNLWYRNGGKVTYDAFKAISAENQNILIHYLKSLPSNIDIEVNGCSYKLVHGSPLEFYNKDIHFEYCNEKEFAVWNRIAYEPSEVNYIIIFGHTTTNHYQTDYPMNIWKYRKMIGVDCGSGYPSTDAGGRLACLRLDDMKEYYSEI